MRAAEFFEFARKRHQIYLDRAAGLPKPWTQDPILATYRFTNVYRELDRTTVWFRENVRDRMLREAEPWEQLFGTILFRAFNRIQTGEAIFQQTGIQGPDGSRTMIATAWDCLFIGRKTDSIFTIRNAVKTAIPRGPWVTGAYIIKTPDGMDKLDGVCWILEQALHRVQDTVAELGDAPSLERLQRLLEAYPYFGPFMAYEVVTDMAHLPMMAEAPDVMTWANAGPGAKRGLNRVYGRELKRGLNQQQACEEMRELLVLSQQTEPGDDMGDYWPQHPDWPPLTMREIEHTLCEFDKYERVRLGEGRPRGRFA
jgi:hypothetical protein